MSEARIGVIGGSGLYQIAGLEEVEEVNIPTPFGEPSDSFVIGKLGNRTRPRKLTMINSLRPTHRTMVTIIRAEYDKKISDSVFTRTYLERKR